MRLLSLRRARTIRLRLTLLYGAVFLVTGVVLLTIGYLVVRHNLHERHTLHEEALRLGLPFYHELFGPPAIPSRELSELRAAATAAYSQAAGNALHRLLVEYAVALLAMTGISVGAGWLLAGRALAPLRAITATAQRVSGENLGERIALDGPGDELKELADTIDGMLVRLDAAFASQRHFVANASHELRTPLTIMRTEIDVALADPNASAEELREMGEAVRETVDRSEGLIAALLVLARSEGVARHEEPVDLSEIVEACVTDLRAQADARGIKSVCEIAPVTVPGDAALLQQLVANLLENAIRHNEVGGSVSVQVSAEGASAELAVENGGERLDPATVGELTEPFRRVNRAAGGFGLGLSVVRSIVQAHLGQLELTAPAGGGLRVRVTLPAVPRGADGGSTASGERRLGRSRAPLAPTAEA